MSFVEGNDPVGQEPQESEAVEESPLSEYAQRFIAQQPEEERPIAEKWVRQWDEGHRKQVEPLRRTVERYRTLGTDDEIEEAVNARRMLIHNPEAVLDWLVNTKGLTIPQAKQAIKDAKEDAADDPYAPKLAELDQKLTKLTEFQLEQLKQKQFEEQKAQFQHDLMQATRGKGDYVKDLALQAISSGQARSIEEAVELAEAYEQRILQSKGRATAPNLLGSGSAPPVGGKKVDWGKASEKEVTEFLTSRLRESNA